LTPAHGPSNPVERLAHSAGITLRQLWRLERNDRPKVWGVTVARLALALGTTTDYLLGLTDVLTRPEPCPPHSLALPAAMIVSRRRRSDTTATVKVIG